MKIGILATGTIANTVAETLNKMEAIECYAVASRNLEKAEAFAQKHGFIKAYGSYLELVEDKEVELIYIASPHSHHYEHALLCLNHGKHALVEKAFCANAEQAQLLIEKAKEKQLYLAEAIWTRYMPMRSILNELVRSKIIGEPTLLTANLGYVINSIPRLLDPNLAGGALLDVGVYPLNFASMVFGNDIEKIQTTAQLSDRGIDLQNSTTLLYKDGKMAVLTSSMLASSDRLGCIYGTKGSIRVENINNPESIKVYNVDHQCIQTITPPDQISGYEYEFTTAINAISQGQIQCQEMNHQEILTMMKLFDNLRLQWGVTFPFE